MSDLYDPFLYELLHRGTEGDLGAYHRMLGGARRVLELGCGYGRVLAGLHRRDPQRSLVGVDDHPGLLARARARLPPSVRLVEADMTTLALGERFDAVIVPYSGLWCLLDDAALAGCLGVAWAHLEPGGRFIADAYAADRFADAEPDARDDDPEPLGEVYTAEGGWRITERSTWYKARSAFTVRYTYEPVDGGPSIDGVIEHRYRTGDALRAALVAAGFEAIRLESGFSGAPFHSDDEHLVVVATRPGRSGSAESTAE